MSDEKPKRMADMQAEVSWNRIGPFDLDHLREEFDRARASEKRLAARLDKARAMVGHILKRVDYREIIKSGGDWACAKCHPNSDILEPGFECALHEAEGFIAEPSALSEVES